MSHRTFFGARELRRRIKSEIENPLAQEILGGKATERPTVEVVYAAKTGLS